MGKLRDHHMEQNKPDTDNTLFLWYMDREMKNRTSEGSRERGGARKDEQSKLGLCRQNTVNACAKRITLKE